MPTANAIPFDLPGFEIEQEDDQAELLVIQAHSTTTRALCPDCEQASSRVHSSYRRSPRDLPCSGRKVRLVLIVRRFRCPNTRCPRQTFAERIPQVVPLHGQRTNRFTITLQRVVLELSAEAGSRVVQGLNMAVSGDTLLRILRQTDLPPVPTTLRVVGVDDWAFKRGYRYGTLVVDLERHRPIDLLPDRTAETLAEWLKAHPGIEVISRDRAGAYAQGARLGAPNAIQVADRWHLLKNLRDALATSYEVHQRLLGQIQLETPAKTECAEPTPSPPPEALANSVNDSPSEPKQRGLSPIQQARAQRRAYWETKFAQVHTLRDDGMSLRAIARELNLSIHTVRKYSRLPELPKKTSPKSGPRLIDPYRTYLRQRLLDGQTSSRPLWQELRERGFPGGHSTVYKAVVQLRKALDLPVPPRASLQSRGPKPVGLTARTLAALVLCLPATLSTPQSQLITDACQLHPDIQHATHLAREFATMLRERAVVQLDPWIHSVKASSFPSLIGFVSGLQHDYEAVKAALTFEWSNGQVEGQINRLKVIKRLMYGRANFDLLRLRVLHPP